MIFGEAVLSGWGDFAALSGDATAALLGLLFVAISIRVDEFAKSAELRNLTAQTGTLLLTGLLIAALLTVPDQRNWALGLEFLVLAIVVGGVTFQLNRWAGSHSDRLGRLLKAINPTFVTCSLLAVAGVTLILGRKNGIYLLVPALIAVLVGGFLNAWLILVKVHD